MKTTSIRILVLSSLMFISTHNEGRDMVYDIPTQQTEKEKNSAFKQRYAQEIDSLHQRIAIHHGFPKPEIVFADFLPLLSNPESFHLCIDLLYKRYESYNISAVVGLESRGFIIGSALAYKLGVGFVPVRKPGKIPGAIYSVSYEKEYGTDSLSIAQNALHKDQRVLVVDDVIATGGSARAAIELVKKTGAIPVAFVSLLQVKELAAQAQLDIPSFNLMN